MWVEFPRGSNEKKRADDVWVKQWPFVHDLQFWLKNGPFRHDPLIGYDLIRKGEFTRKNKDGVKITLVIEETKRETKWGINHRRLRA